MTTGARRGELCALRWDDLDLDRAAPNVRSAIAQEDSQTWEKDTKTHQQRRIALDQTTVGLLSAYRRQYDEVAAALGVEIYTSNWLFSPAPDHSRWVTPSSVSQRYARMCARLGWDMNIHELRHYSATELISAGSMSAQSRADLGTAAVARQRCAPTQHARGGDVGRAHAGPPGGP